MMMTILSLFSLTCSGSQCERAVDQLPSPIQRSDSGSCAQQGYVRRLPSIQYVRKGVEVRDVSLMSFRVTGGYLLHGLRHSDVNNNQRRGGLQFNFWKPVTIASMRFVQTRVGHDFCAFGSTFSSKLSDSIIIFFTTDVEEKKTKRNYKTP